MNQEVFNEKLRAVITSESFSEMINRGASNEELAKLFADQGIEIPATEVRTMIDKLVHSSDGELEEDSLEDVSGGSLSDILKWGKDILGFANDCKPDGKYGSTIQKGFDAVYKWGFKKGIWR